MSDCFVLSVEIHSEVADGQADDEAEEVQQLFTSSRGYCARKGVSKADAMHVESGLTRLYYYSCIKINGIHKYTYILPNSGSFKAGSTRSH